MSFDDVMEAIRGSRFFALADRLEDLVLPSIRLEAEPAEMDNLNLGASRFGGVPDMPPETQWPEAAGRPMSFLAQIRLRDLRRFEEAAGLTPDGWLCFFYDNVEQRWGFDPNDRDHWRVLYFDAPLDTLERRPAPNVGEEVEAPFASCRLTPTIEYMLPHVDVVQGTLEMEFDDAEIEDYEKLFARVNGDAGATRHRMFGFPEQIQGDMRLECQLVSNGLYCGDSTGYEDPRAAELEPGMFEWLLLLQIDTDEDGPGWMWGDSGRLYFWIREEDLAAGRFEKTWCVLQCY